MLFKSFGVDEEGAKAGLTNIAKVYGIKVAGILALGHNLQVTENQSLPRFSTIPLPSTAISAFPNRRFRNNFSHLQEFALALPVPRAPATTGSFHNCFSPLSTNRQTILPASVRSFLSPPSSSSVPNCYSIPIAQRIRQRLPSSLLIENASD